MPIPSSFQPGKAFTFSIDNITETQLWFRYDGLLYAIDLQESTTSVNEIGVNGVLLMGIITEIDQQRFVFVRRTDMRNLHETLSKVFDNEFPSNLAGLVTDLNGVFCSELLDKLYKY